MKQILFIDNETKINLFPENFLKKDTNSLIEEMLFKYGTDSLSYLSLGHEKQYFIAKNTDGFIAYVVIGNIAVCVGNPICMNSKLLQIINEFKEFCVQRKLKICFSSISKEFSELLKDNDFVISKYGEEAVLELDSYFITGKKTEKLRQKLRRAEKCGVRIEEYYPNLKRDKTLENKIQLLNQEWFSNKKDRLTFTLGDLNFDNPLDRRFFVALDENEEVLAILMFSPFNGQKGYFLDVMRRKLDSVPGVMEKAIIDAAMQIKSEGGKWISIGLAPLAGIDVLNSKCTLLEKLFNFVFHYGNSSYCFQSLYNYKKKFNPTYWKDRYVAHEKGISSIKIAYALLKSRNVDNVFKQAVLCIYIFLKNIKSIYKKMRKFATKLILKPIA